MAYTGQITGRQRLIAGSAALLAAFAIGAGLVGGLDLHVVRAASEAISAIAIPAPKPPQGVIALANLLAADALPLAFSCCVFAGAMTSCGVLGAGMAMALIASLAARTTWRSSPLTRPTPIAIAANSAALPARNR